MELKWALAIALEAAFWLMLAAFLVLRYRYGMESITRLFVIGVVIDTAGLVALGIWDYTETGSVNAYTIVIAGLVAYGLIFGKREMQRLDAWMAARVKPRSGTT
jgi:drug/metabolite transporter (DMT)-like permease